MLRAPRSGTINRARKPARTIISRTGDFGIVQNVRDLDRHALLNCLADRCLATTNTTILDLGDYRVIHSIGRAQSKFLTFLVEHVDRPGLGSRELSCFSNDCGQHGLQVDGGIYRLAHVAERSKFLNGLSQLRRALLDLLLEPIGRLCLFREQLIAFQSVLTENLNYPSHFRDFVAAHDVDWSVAAAGGDGEHAAAQTHQPPDEIAADIEPDDSGSS